MERQTDRQTDKRRCKPYPATVVGLCNYRMIMYVGDECRVVWCGVYSQTSTLHVRQGETSCIQCRALSDPRPQVTIYHGTASSQSSHELGAPDRHGSAAYTRAGVGVERYVDVASGGVVVVEYTFPRTGGSDADDGWTNGEELPGLRAGVTFRGLACQTWTTAGPTARSYRV